MLLKSVEVEGKQYLSQEPLFPSKVSKGNEMKGVNKDGYILAKPIMCQDNKSPLSRIAKSVWPYVSLEAM